MWNITIQSNTNITGKKGIRSISLIIYQKKFLQLCRLKNVNKLCDKFSLNFLKNITSGVKKVSHCAWNWELNMNMNLCQKNIAPGQIQSFTTWSLKLSCFIINRMSCCNYSISLFPGRFHLNLNLICIVYGYLNHDLIW